MIVSCKENDRARYARWANDVPGGWEVGTSYVVVTDDPVNDGPIEVARAPGLPFKDDRHEQFPILFCDEIAPRQRPGTLTIWDVDVVYRVPDDEPIISPLAEPLKVQWGKTTIQEPYYFDVDGVPIANSAGEPYDPPRTRPRTVPSLRIVRNEPSYNPALFQPFFDSVNALPFWHGQPGQVYCAGTTADGPNSRNGVTFWSVTYEFFYQEDPWDIEVILDQGLNELVDGRPQANEPPKVLRAITRQFINYANRVPTQPQQNPADVQYIPISEPVPLNGQGRILPKTRLLPGGQEVPNEPFYLHARRLHRMNFGLLPYGPLVQPAQ